MNLSLTFGKRLFFFACITVLFYVVTSLVVGFIVWKGGADAPKWMRIAAVLQDLLLFIVPAVITAMVCTRLPARFLMIDSRPASSAVFIAICTLIVSVPAMNQIIMWNDSISLPESMASLEQSMRHAEEAAREQVAVLIGGTSVMSLVVSIAIVGILAGLSEELFFRGAFQRLLTTGGVNVHVAVWIVAILFSAMHMQFYGFFPRMLLGAYFGYLVVWTRSLWVPVIAHIFNNTVYICGQWAMERALPADAAGASDAAASAPSAVDSLGQGNWFLVAASVVLTIIGLTILYRRRQRD